MAERTYYPDYEIDKGYIRTYVRKEKDGIWYDVPLFMQFNEINLIAIKQFIREAYYLINLHIVRPDLCNHFNGVLLEEKSNIQISEKERLKKIILG